MNKLQASEILKSLLLFAENPTADFTGLRRANRNQSNFATTGLVRPPWSLVGFDSPAYSFARVAAGVPGSNTKVEHLFDLCASGCVKF